MKKQILKIALISFAFVGVNSVFAQEVQTEKKAKFSIEIDPATFAFKGYGVHLRYQPKNSSHVLFGAGVYAMDMPSALVDFDSKNKELGWGVRLNQGIGVFGEHHFSEVNKKWFVGAQMSWQEYKIKNKKEIGESKYQNGLAMLYAGYTFRPFKFNFYIKPWAGVGYTQKISGENTIGLQTYNINPITFFATLHVGYTF